MAKHPGVERIKNMGKGASDNDADAVDAEADELPKDDNGKLPDLNQAPDDRAIRVTGRAPPSERERRRTSRRNIRSGVAPAPLFASVGRCRPPMMTCRRRP